MKEFDGHVSLVTGATRGIGRAIAERLHSEGARVIGLGRDEETGGALEKHLQRFRFIRADVSDGQQVEEAIQTTLEEWGRIDHLVCNAGITRDQLLLRMTDEDWHRVLAVNLDGTFYCIRAALRHFIRRRAGSIVAVSSVVGQTGNAGQANYAASKAAIVALCRSLAKEIGARGIRVNVVAPGLIETDMTAVLSEEVRGHLVEQIPLQRIGTANEVAEAVSFLLSDRASYITGQVLGINGGMYP